MSYRSCSLYSPQLRPLAQSAVRLGLRRASDEDPERHAEQERQGEREPDIDRDHLVDSDRVCTNFSARRGLAGLSNTR